MPRFEIVSVGDLTGSAMSPRKAERTYRVYFTSIPPVPGTWVENNHQGFVDVDKNILDNPTLLNRAMNIEFEAYAERVRKAQAKQVYEDSFKGKTFNEPPEPKKRHWWG